MFDSINLDESNSYLCDACNIVLKDDNWFVILGESTLLYDIFVHCITILPHGSFVKNNRLRVVCRGGHDGMFHELP